MLVVSQEIVVISIITTLDKEKKDNGRILLIWIAENSGRVAAAFFLV